MLGHGSKAAMLDVMPAGELAFWAALIEIKAKEREDAQREAER